MFLVEHEVTHWDSIRNFPQLGDEAGRSEHHCWRGLQELWDQCETRPRYRKMMSTGGGAAEAICTENGC